MRFAVFVVRTKRAATESFLTEARQAIWSVNANLPVSGYEHCKDLYDQSMARTSFTLVMLAIAGGMALVLGHRGDLRRDRLRRLAADARDRHPHGAGRAVHGTPANVRAARAAAGWNRRRRWDWPPPPD